LAIGDWGMANGRIQRALEDFWISRKERKR